jgi:hypothetical protein
LTAAASSSAAIRDFSNAIRFFSRATMMISSSSEAVRFLPFVFFSFVGVIGASESSDMEGLAWTFEARCFRISVAAGAKSSSGSSGAGFGGGGFIGEENSGKGLLSSNELRCVADFRDDCFVAARFGVVLVKKSSKRSTCVFAVVLVRGFILDQYRNQESYFLLHWWWGFDFHFTLSWRSFDTVWNFGGKCDQGRRRLGSRLSGSLRTLL